MSESQTPIPIVLAGITLDEMNKRIAKMEL